MCAPVLAEPTALVAPPTDDEIQLVMHFFKAATARGDAAAAAVALCSVASSEMRHPYQDDESGAGGSGVCSGDDGFGAGIAGLRLRRFESVTVASRADEARSAPSRAKRSRRRGLSQESDSSFCLLDGGMPPQVQGRVTSNSSDDEYVDESMVPKAAARRKRSAASFANTDAGAGKGRFCLTLLGAGCVEGPDPDVVADALIEPGWRTRFTHVKVLKTRFDPSSTRLFPQVDLTLLPNPVPLFLSTTPHAKLMELLEHSLHQDMDLKTPRVGNKLLSDAVQKAVKNMTYRKVYARDVIPRIAHCLMHRFIHNLQPPPDVTAALSGALPANSYFISIPGYFCLCLSKVVYPTRSDVKMFLAYQLLRLDPKVVSPHTRFCECSLNSRASLHIIRAFLVRFPLLKQSAWFSQRASARVDA